MLPFVFLDSNVQNGQHTLRYLESRAPTTTSSRRCSGIEPYIDMNIYGISYIYMAYMGYRSICEKSKKYAAMGHNGSMFTWSLIDMDQIF